MGQWHVLNVSSQCCVAQAPFDEESHCLLPAPSRCSSPPPVAGRLAIRLPARPGSRWIALISGAPSSTYSSKGARPIPAAPTFRILSAWPLPIARIRTRTTTPSVACAIAERVRSVPRHDVPKVAVLQPATSTFWESVAGGVTVTGADGRSGNLSAILQASSASLQASTGNTVVPGPTLSVDGPWSCP